LCSFDDRRRSPSGLAAGSNPRLEKTRKQARLAISTCTDEGVKMSLADVERFVSDLKNTPELLQQITSGTTGLTSLVAEAKERGYDISLEEAKAYIRDQAKQDLTDEQLDAVAGGKSAPQVTTTTQAQGELECVVECEVGTQTSQTIETNTTVGQYVA
jgi:predicted ribosomally synthesized peptide with nif11-like leader